MLHRPKKFNYRELRLVGRALAMYQRSHSLCELDDCYNLFEKLGELQLTRSDIDCIVQQFERYPL